MDSNSSNLLSKIQVENSIPSTSEERRKKSEENAKLLKLLQEEFIRSKMLADKMAENEREIKRLEEKRRQDIKLQKVKRILEAETIIRDIKNAEEEMKLRERIAEMRDEIQHQKERERKQALEEEVALLRGKLHLKQLEQRLYEKEFELKVQAEKDEKLQSEINKMKLMIAVENLNTQQIEYTKALLAAEKVEMDERPEHIQYQNTKEWTESTGEHLIYVFDPLTGDVKVHSNSKVSFKYNPQPFSKGSVRFAHYALLSPRNFSDSMSSSSSSSSSQSSDDYLQVVIKRLLFSRGREYDFPEVIEMVKTQLTGRYFGDVFNRDKPEHVPKMIYCNLTVLYEVKGSTHTIWSVEDILSGDFCKWNNNGLFVNESEIAPQTLSHFSYVHSSRKMLLVDIQGVKRGSKKEGEHVFILTDPALHTEDGLGFGDLNCGMKGMQKFFTKHRCNEICKQMKLDSQRECDYVPDEEDDS